MLCYLPGEETLAARWVAFVLAASNRLARTCAGRFKLTKPQDTNSFTGVGTVGFNSHSWGMGRGREAREVTGQAGMVCSKTTRPSVLMTIDGNAARSNAPRQTTRWRNHVRRGVHRANDQDPLAQGATQHAAPARPDLWHPSPFFILHSSFFILTSVHVPDIRSRAPPP
jgi:hypothetical protein